MAASRLRATHIAAYSARPYLNSPQTTGDDDEILEIFERPKLILFIDDRLGTDRTTALWGVAAAVMSRRLVNPLSTDLRGTVIPYASLMS